MNWLKKHKLIAGIIAVIVIAVVATSADKKELVVPDQPAQTNQSQDSEPKNNSTAKLNEPVRDGKFEFVVKSFECGKTEVVSPESEFLNKQAQGQYCLLTLTVKNIKDEQQGFFSSNQKLLDSTSKVYGADDLATSYNAPSSQESTWAQINPGNSIDAVVVFDVPKDIVPTAAELHDSAFSNGVKVILN